MRERGEQLRFALEPREAIGIGRLQVGEDLQRDVAAEPVIARPVNLTHPAGAERSDHFVDAEPGSGGQRHEGWIIAGGGWHPSCRSFRERRLTDARG